MAHLPYCQWIISRSAWLAHSWERSTKRRNAYDKIHCQQGTDFYPECINESQTIRIPYRIFVLSAVKYLKKINYNANSDNFVFDNQMLAQIWYAGYEVAEITCPTKYFDDASSINLKNSSIYGLGGDENFFAVSVPKMGIDQVKIFRGIRRKKSPRQKKEASGSTGC